MPFEDAPAVRGWTARLALGFASRGEATVLAHRRHEGPLVVQKPLYPEGPGVCHAILVHPPSGLAGGDRVEVDLDLHGSAHALITTPGAGKWYRSAGDDARQRLSARVRERTVLEWLPQEAILYDEALADMRVDVSMSTHATYIGMEMLCLGRTASGERFDRGRCRVATRLVRDGETLWLERGTIEGGSPLLASPLGMAGEPVVGTLLAASPNVSGDLLAPCRAVPCEAGRGALTLLPGLLVARWLGPACEPGRRWLASLWDVLRPALTGRAPHRPRIWNT